MRFGLFYEHQIPRPWEDGAEEKLLNDALDQVELADGIGIDSVWEVEHHFLEEYSHSSAPEVFLAAASQRTKNIRLGHGIVQLPPNFNHPARVAERVSTLDLISGGRVEFGTGEGSAQAELGAFGVPREDKHAQWEESLDIVTRMMVEQPFAGHQGRYTSMPPRNVVPKPKQKPHPPLWVACSRRNTILDAARKGIGALTFSFVEPEAAKEWVDEYYAVIESDECVAAGFAVNPNFAVVLPMMCHKDEQTAIDRGIDGAHFFGYSLTYYYVFGKHVPGETNIWEKFQAERTQAGFAREVVNADDGPLGVKLLQEGIGSLRGAIGTPAQIEELVRRYEDAGVDQIIFVSQCGKNRHEHICESLELFGRKVLPKFTEGREQREAEKRERLAAACERALARREPARVADPGYLITPEGEPRPVVTEPIGGRAIANGSSPRIMELVRKRLKHAGQSAFAAYVRGRSDRQLERTIGSKAGLRTIFKGMERAFEPERANGFVGDIQYVLTAGSGNGDRRWIVSIAADRATARAGSALDPTVTLKMSVPTFARIVAGEANPAKEMIEGNFEVTSSFDVAVRLGEMFGEESAF